MSEVVPVVVCAIVRNGKVLFIRRRKFPFEGLLSLPGGKIEYGETLEQASERELREELGMETRFVQHLSTIPEHVSEKGKVLVHLMIQLCEMEHLSNLGRGEYEYLWLSPEDIEELRTEITPSDYHMVREIIHPGLKRNFYSLIEKSGQGYKQREFREI